MAPRDATMTMVLRDYDEIMLLDHDEETIYHDAKSDVKRVRFHETIRFHPYIARSQIKPREARRAFCSPREFEDMARRAVAAAREEDGRGLERFSRAGAMTFQQRVRAAWSCVLNNAKTNVDAYAQVTAESRTMALQRGRADERAVKEQYEQQRQKEKRQRQRERQRQQLQQNVYQQGKRKPPTKAERQEVYFLSALSSFIFIPDQYAPVARDWRGLEIY